MIQNLGNIFMTRLGAGFLSYVTESAQSARPYKGLERLNSLSDAQLARMNTSRANEVMRIVGANSV